MRVKIIRLIIIGLFLIIALDLVYIQAIRGGYFYHLSKNNRIRVVPVEGKRGRIFDRYGTVLADNRSSFNVMLIPQEIKDQGKLFRYLSKVLEIDQKRLQKKFKQKLFAPFAPVIIAEDIEKEVAIVLEENKFRFPGLFVQMSVKRLYPFKDVGAHVLGYVGRINRSKIERLKDYGYTPQDVIGYSGIEEYYDNYLKGEGGGSQIEINSRGQQVRLLSLKESRSGQDITLTIDNNIQKIAAALLSDQHGAIIVMDIKSGEILGLVSSPSYDPNIFVDSTKRNKVSAVFSDSLAPLLNRAISGQYPPGSVFKIPVALAALDMSKITSYTSFLCPGGYKTGDREFHCAHIHGDQNLTEAIVHSCNVYFYNLGVVLGVDLLNKYAQMLGLGAITNIDLPFEESGLIPSREQKRNACQQRWYKGDTLNFSIGQGDTLATPLQLVQLMATVARNGEKVQPHLINTVDVERNVPKSLIDIQSEKFELIKVGLRSAVSDSSGTAHLLDISGLSVCGKTGTAQTSGGRKHHAWFVGYSNLDTKKIAFCVFLEHGGSSYNACRVARKLLLDLKEKQIN